MLHKSPIMLYHMAQCGQEQKKTATSFPESSFVLLSYSQRIFFDAIRRKIFYVKDGYPLRKTP